MMQLMVFSFVATFLFIAVVGHGLLIAALIQCTGDDPAGGRPTPAAARPHRGHVRFAPIAT